MHNQILWLIESLPLPLIELPEIESLDKEPFESSTSSSYKIQHIDGNVHQQSTSKEQSHPDNSIECSSVPNVAISEPLESPLEQLTSFSISNIISEIDQSFNSDESTTSKLDTADASSQKRTTSRFARVETIVSAKGGLCHHRSNTSCAPVRQLLL